MKTMLATMMVLVAAVATVATARPHATHKVSDAEVQAAIDERLHELLVKLNDQRRAN
jgi:ABC-type transporter MlaC component